MGLVSLSEDIEEQREHFKSGVDNLLNRWLSETRALGHHERTQRELEDLSQRMVAHLQNLQAQVHRVFDDARTRLADPNVMIVKRSDKIAAERDDFRERLRKAELELSKSRQTGSNLKDKPDKALAETANLRIEISGLRKSEKMAWHKETENVKPVRKR